MTITKTFRPMLAEQADFDTLRFPLIASPKIDGVRATIHLVDGHPTFMSRSMKPLPNRFMQNWLVGKFHLIGLDGELIVGSPTADNACRNTTSFVMSNDKVGEFDWTYHVFDHYNPPQGGAGFKARLTAVVVALKGAVGMSCQLSGTHRGTITVVKHAVVHSAEQLSDYEAAALQAGYEGVMTRDPQMAYKHGRSTTKEQGLLKVKRSHDMEARVLSLEEQMHNANDKVTNEYTGRSQRGVSVLGLTGKNTLGSMRVVGTTPGNRFMGVEFNVGSGLNDAERAWIWATRDDPALTVVGNIARVRYFNIGTMDAPRHPVFVAWRSALDLDAPTECVAAE